VLVAQGAVALVGNSVLSLQYMLAQPSFGVSQYTLAGLGGFVEETLVDSVPLALGVFISFTFIAPLHASLGLRAVALRSLIAAAAGSLLSMGFALCVAALEATAAVGSLFGNSFPTTSLDSQGFFLQVTASAMSAVDRFATVLPLVLLAGILNWIWLMRRAAAVQNSAARGLV
jgi:hypothetical protein